MNSPTLEEFDVEKNIKDNDEPIVLSEKDDSELDEEYEEDKELNLENKNEEDEKDEKDEKDEEDEDDEENKEEDKDEKPILINTETFINEDELNNISSDEETDSDDEYTENMNKLEQDINKDLIYSYHPETKQINFKELLALSKISRNKKGQIIDPLHTTLPFLTRFEKAKILGLRAKQINHGSKPFIEVTRNIIDGHTIAHMELLQNKIPFIIRRPLPNGGSEYWKVNDLKNLE